MIRIYTAETGAGKTFDALGEAGRPGENKALFSFDMENRQKKLKPTDKDKTIDLYFADREITHIPCLKYTKDYLEDHVATLKEFQKYSKQLRTTNHNFKTLLVDGISNLREYAHTMWCKDNNRKHAVNPGDWEEVNDYVRADLFPLINYCRKHDITLILTCQFKDDYQIIEVIKEGKKVKESQKAGRIPALKEWQAYGSDLIIELQVRKGKYFANCTKSLLGVWEADITNQSLSQVLEDMGL